jgi:hypothetical protein
MTVADLKASEMFAEAQLSLENYDIELAKTQAL